MLLTPEHMRVYSENEWDFLRSNRNVVSLFLIVEIGSESCTVVESCRDFFRFAISIKIPRSVEPPGEWFGVSECKLTQFAYCSQFLLN